LEANAPIRERSRRRHYLPEARGAGLERNASTIGSKADGVVPATQQEKIEQLILGELPGQPAPQSIVDLGPVVQAVCRLDEQPVALVAPTPVVRLAWVREVTCPGVNPTLSEKKATCTPH